MAIDSLWTAVKIRGKRSATRAEKWRTGNKRSPALQKRASAQEPTASQNALQSSITIPAKPPKRPLRKLGLSPLESLPTEIVQLIFMLSDNFDLPLISRTLADKLSSEHLHHVMAVRLLSPVLGQGSQDGKKVDLANATRLLNCRFVDWRWFRRWLRQTASTNSVRWAGIGNAELWLAMDASPQLMPPRQLFRRPFTMDKLEFLSVFATSAKTLHDNEYYIELAHQGLMEAVQDGHTLAVGLLLSLGLRPSTDHLRYAVADNDCNKNIVELLMSNRPNPGPVADSSLSQFDLLDPVVWAWIEKAQARGDEKGTWLKELLRKARRTDTSTMS